LKHPFPNGNLQKQQTQPVPKRRFAEVTETSLETESPKSAEVNSFKIRWANYLNALSEWIIAFTSCPESDKYRLRLPPEFHLLPTD
jgi:hypothetical protein